MTPRTFDYCLAGTSGALLALSFPNVGHPALGWVALAPLLVVLHRSSYGRAFFAGLLTGVVYFAGTLYWITRVMVLYGGLNVFVAVLVNLALIAYLALFPALFAVVVWRLLTRIGPVAITSVPLVWVATELGRTYLLTGFPWVLLGYSQASVLPVVQVASIVGVYGISGLVAAASSAIVACSRAPKRRWQYIWAASVGLAVCATALWGQSRLARGDLLRQGQAIKVGLVQGNVDQGEKWDEQRAGAIFSSYLRMTREAMEKGADIVLWPESSTPFFFEEDRPAAEQVRALARRGHVPILLGSDQIVRGSPDKYYNSAFVVGPDGSTGGVYRKMHLVPFGEYVPLKRLLFFAGPLVEAVSDFSAGESAALLPVGGHELSAAICYEIVYPDLVRRFVTAGSELLTTITNDAWFGRTAAPYQHFEQAAMRAVENGRYLVRSANTGISGIVDPYGRVTVRSAIFEPAVIVAEARYLQGSTFYTRHGDLFAYGATAFTLALLLQSQLWRQSRN